MFGRKKADSAEERSITYQDVFGEPAPVTHAGIAVSQETAMRLAAVYSCVTLISDTIASLPLHTYRSADGLRVSTAPPAWVARPNPLQARFCTVQQVLAGLLLDGNAYLYLLRNASGAVAELHPLHPSRVVPRLLDNGTIEYLVDGREMLSASELLHISAFTMPGQIRGISPIEVARQAIGLGLVAEEFGSLFFGQGATVSGVVQSPAPMNREQAEVMARSFAAHHAGARKAHLPLILTAGATWQQITIPPEQAQFLETRRFQRQEIANLYRVPGYLIDPSVSSTWGTGIEQQQIGFIQFTLQPWLTRIEEALSGLLPRGQFVKFNLDALLRGSTKDRYDAYAVALDHGFMTLNEVRAREDLPPLTEVPPLAA